ncbi:LysR family transcriptional regulator [Aureimonas sp. Leaf324]|uniref:LysR family transcriptional regulator n=1 Tax=Aureimonas sp. Leaf324 TaxID=1736336 RepID=UPI000700FF63|nr:LysR family transcriptional regulator [Aureimonas sp. Leaf324]KQQ85635.1 hypothetical protein ASF65_03530 [Aureimonas sp. Leaf324]
MGDDALAEEAAGPRRPVDARKVTYFAQIVLEGSLSRAAKVLGLSQPALSMSMDSLERELGTKLLRRGAHGVEPTEQGEILFRHARNVLETLRTAEDELKGSPGNSHGVLRFGCLPTLAGSIVPRAIRQWRGEHPHLELQVTERPQNELLWGLLRHDHDFSIGVVDPANHAYGLRQRVLFREQLHVVAGSSHPLAAQAVVTLDDIIEHHWVTPTTGWRNTALERILEPAGLTLRHKVTVCSSMSLLKSLITDSPHLALLPAHAVQEELADARVVLLPFHQVELERSIAVFLRDGSELSPPGQALVRWIQQQGRRRFSGESDADIPMHAPARADTRDVR